MSTTVPSNDTTASDNALEQLVVSAQAALKPAVDALRAAGLTIDPSNRRYYRIRHGDRAVADLYMNIEERDERVILSLLGVAAHRPPERHYKAGTRSANAIVRTVLARVTELQIKASQEAERLTRHDALRADMDRILGAIGEKAYMEGPLEVSIDDDARGFELKLHAVVTPAQLDSLVNCAVMCGVQRVSGAHEAK